MIASVQPNQIPAPAPSDHSRRRQPPALFVQTTLSVHTLKSAKGSVTTIAAAQPTPAANTEARNRASRSRPVMMPSLQQPQRYFDIEIDRFEELLLRQLFMRSVSHMD